MAILARPKLCLTERRRSSAVSGPLRLRRPRGRGQQRPLARRRCETERGETDTDGQRTSADRQSGQHVRRVATAPPDARTRPWTRLTRRHRNEGPPESRTGQGTRKAETHREFHSSRRKGVSEGQARSSQVQPGPKDCHRDVLDRHRGRQRSTFITLATGSKKRR